METGRYDDFYFTNIEVNLPLVFSMYFHALTILKNADSNINLFVINSQTIAHDDKLVTYLVMQTTGMLQMFEKI